MNVRWRSLYTSIIGWSFVPTAIIMLMVALVTFYAYQQVTEDLVIGRNREVTRFSAGQLASDLRGYADLLATIARTSGLQTNDVQAQRLALSGASNRLVVFDAGVVLLDNFGRVVAADPARPEDLGHDWSDRAYFRAMLRFPQTVFSDVVRDGQLGSDVIVVAVPVADGEGRLQGVLAGMFRLGSQAVSAFYGSIAKLRIGESGSVYIVDSAGRVVYHSDPDFIGADLSAESIVREVAARRPGDLRLHNAQGKEVIASYAPIPGTPWGLVTEEDWDILLSSSQGYRQSLLILLALGVVLPVVVVTFGVRRITGSIRSLIEAAQEVAGGNFGRVIAAPMGGELAELAQQFNVMSAKLQESYANLERRVADRTRELATLNAIASAVSRSLELEEVFQDALDKTLEVTGMEAGVAHRLDESSGYLVLAAQRGLSERLAEQVSRLSPSQALVGVGDVSRPAVFRVTDLPASELSSQMVEDGMQQCVVVPLVAKGRLLGTLHLCTRSPRALTTEELSLLAAVGQQVGVAVENARLYERAEESAAAAERSRLARDLHDAVSQTLFSASLIAEVLPRLWERNPEEGRRRLEELRQLTRGALAEMRTLLLELRPSVLREVALNDLLRQLCEAITGRARLPVQLAIEGEADLPPEVRVAFYRVAQESLNNVAKHAGATAVSVSLHSRDDATELVVSDDGRGFDPTHIPPDHLGLSIMRERAEAVGAVLALDSVPGQGTRVRLYWQREQ